MAMARRRILGVLALAVATAVAVGLTYPETAAEWREAADYRAFLETAPLAQAEGDAVSPDGRYELQQIDRGGDGEAVPSMETVQLVDTSTGEVLWEEKGYYETSALWSPEGTYVALFQRQRACGSVTVVETETFTSWQMPLPEDVKSAEYAWISAEEWVDSDTLRIRYRDTREEGEGTFYRCSLVPGDPLTGTFLKETAAALPGNYDFDHDGLPETTVLMTIGEPAIGNVAWFEIHITRNDGLAFSQDTSQGSLAVQSLALQHPGWGSIFACSTEEGDALLVLTPTMYQGWAEYSYELLVFDEAGEAYTVDSRAVIFDTNFGREGHQFDAGQIAEFFWHLREYLQNSTVLASTENGKFQTSIPGLELQNYMFGDLLSLDSLEAMEASVRQQEAEMRAEQGAV